MVLERAAVRDAALTLTASSAAEQAAAERAAAEQAATERAAASTLFNVAMPPLPPQQGGAMLLLCMRVGYQLRWMQAVRCFGGGVVRAGWGAVVLRRW